MDNYTHVGIVFKRVKIDNKYFLNPIDYTELNINENGTYFTKDFGPLENVFTNQSLKEEYLAGFLARIDDLIRLGGNIDKGLEMYLDSTLIFNYVQIVENNGVIKTYKIDIKNNLMQLALFDGTRLYFTNEYICDFDVNHIYNKLTNSIIGQNEAIKNIVSTISRNLNSANHRNKRNIILMGPTNTGKTDIFRIIKENTNIPITYIYCEEHLKTGFDDSNLYNTIYDLVFESKGNIKKAQKGIVVIDNVDYLFKDDNNSKSLVIDKLISFIEGNETVINFNNDFNIGTIKFDSSFVTFVFIGNFELLLSEKKTAGFNTIENSKSTEDDLTSLRFPRKIINNASIYKTKKLTANDLYDIMTNSEYSALFEYYGFANDNGVKLNVTEGAIRTIAELAYEKNIGAEGIKLVLEEILGDAIFEIEMNRGIYSSIKLTKDTMEKNPPYVLYKRKNKTSQIKL